MLSAPPPLFQQQKLAASKTFDHHDLFQQIV